MTSRRNRKDTGVFFSTIRIVSRYGRRCGKYAPNGVTLAPGPNGRKRPLWAIRKVQKKLLSSARTPTKSNCLRSDGRLQLRPDEQLRRSIAHRCKPSRRGVDHAYVAADRQQPTD